MSTDQASLTTTQIGQVAESIVAAHITLCSQGRLSVFRPDADDDGLDLLAYNKRTGVSWPIQVKSRRTNSPKGSKTVHFDVRKATFSALPNAILLGVLLDLKNDKLDIQRAWLIPMKDLPEVANVKESVFTVRASMDMNSKDKYTPYRYDSMAQVVERLLSKDKQ